MYDDMAEKIRNIQSNISAHGQLLVGIAGPPGVGPQSYIICISYIVTS